MIPIGNQAGSIPVVTFDEIFPCTPEVSRALKETVAKLKVKTGLPKLN